MNDRELLELAAKAAGIEPCPCMGKYCRRWYVNGRSWNPLTSDRDALRLAVQLQISVEFGEDGNNGPTYMAGYFTDNGNRLRYAIEHETPAQDASAATRRAIVRAAAAEIGKSR